MFGPNNITNYKQNDHPNTWGGIHYLSANKKYACFIRDNCLIVDETNTLKTLKTHPLDSQKGIVVCDNKNLNNIYVATENKVQGFLGDLMSVQWTYEKHGADSLNLTKYLTKDSQDKSILICSQNKKVFALDPENGQKLWKYNIPDHFVLNNSGITSILPQENNSLIVSFNGNVAVRDASKGTELWESIMWANQSKLNGIATMKGKPSNCNDLIGK